MDNPAPPATQKPAFRLRDHGNRRYFHDHFVFSLVPHGPAGALSRFEREKPVKSGGRLARRGAPVSGRYGRQPATDGSPLRAAGGFQGFEEAVDLGWSVVVDEP